MDSLLVALPALGCVLMMPAMMWLISRMRSDNPASDLRYDLGAGRRAAAAAGQGRTAAVGGLRPTRTDESSPVGMRVDSASDVSQAGHD